MWLQSYIKSSLKTHRMSLHESVKYPCNLCKYKATLKSSLKIHEISVHESAKYQCTQCDYKFTHKNNIKQHVMSVHKVSSIIVINAQPQISYSFFLTWPRIFFSIAPKTRHIGATLEGLPGFTKPNLHARPFIWNIWSSFWGCSRKNFTAG